MHKQGLFSRRFGPYAPYAMRRSRLRWPYAPLGRLNMLKEIFQNRISVISLIITTLSLLLAAYQYARAEKIDKMNENKCEIRCKDLVNSVHILSIDVMEACKALEFQVEKLDITSDKLFLY